MQREVQGPTSLVKADAPALSDLSDGLVPPPPAGGPIGLHAFFSGLAAGDEMVGLVQTLRRTVLEHVFPEHDRRECEGHADTTESPPIHLPSFSSSMASLRAAIKAAMLLSTEHPIAAEEATFFYHSPSTHSCLLRDSRREEDHDRRTVFPIHEGRLRMLLSDRAAVVLARRHLRTAHHAEAALQVLSQVEPTPAVCALLVECHCEAGQWKEALASLHAIPPPLWTEVDVSHAIRALYHAALSGEVETMRSPSSSPSSHSSTYRNPLTEPLRLLATARENGVLWSSPGAVNDALGLLSLDRRLWPHAVELLDSLLLSSSSLSSSSASPSSPTSTPEPPAAHLPSEPASTSVAVTTTNHSDEMLTFYATGEGDLVPHQPVWELFDAFADTAVNSSSSNSRQHGRGSSPSLSTRDLRANAVTVFQACGALRARPDLAFRYANALVKTHKIAYSTDFKATEAFLRVCVRDGRWDAALAVLREARHGAADGTARGKHKGKEGTHQHGPRAYSADILLSLLRLLGEKGATEHYAEVFASLWNSSGFVSNGANPEAPARDLSKYYRTRTLYRAYNTMIQHASRASEAEGYYAALKSIASPSWSPGEPEDGANEPGSGGEDARLESKSYERLTMLYAQEGDWERALGCLNTLLHHPKRKLHYVPTPAVHDAVQYALEQSAACSARSSQLPSQAPSSPPLAAPWQVSVALFKEMCEREVPTSPIAFRSVVRSCFAQGASEEAQKLFQLLMRRGVRR